METATTNNHHHPMTSYRITTSIRKLVVVVVACLAFQTSSTEGRTKDGTLAATATTTTTTTTNGQQQQQLRRSLYNKFRTEPRVPEFTNVEYGVIVDTTPSTPLLDVEALKELTGQQQDKLAGGPPHPPHPPPPPPKADDGKFIVGESLLRDTAGGYNDNDAQDEEEVECPDDNSDEVTGDENNDENVNDETTGDYEYEEETDWSSSSSSSSSKTSKGDYRATPPLPVPPGVTPTTSTTEPLPDPAAVGRKRGKSSKSSKSSSSKTTKMSKTDCPDVGGGGSGSADPGPPGGPDHGPDGEDPPFVDPGADGGNNSTDTGGTDTGGTGGNSTTGNSTLPGEDGGDTDSFIDTAGCPGEVFDASYSDDPPPARLVQAESTTAATGLAALFKYPDGAFAPPAYISDASSFSVSVGLVVNLGNIINGRDTTSDITNDGSFDGNDVAAEINKLNEPIILYTGGCGVQAQEAGKAYVEANTQQRRKLQTGDETAYLVAGQNWACPSYECDTSQNPVSCQATCESLFQVWGPDDVLDGVWSERLSEAIKKFFPLMGSTTVWYQQGQAINPTVTSTGDKGVDSIVDGNSAVESTTRVGPYIGAAAGTLALLLLVLFLVRRNQNDDDGSRHLKLQDDGDDTFIKEFASDSSQLDYVGRDVHVVGEEDSVFSHWTGYSGKRNSGGGIGTQYVSTDVHKCASATCEVCERRRQQGVSFVASGGRVPSRTPSVPSDASRNYPSEDTVEL